VPKWLEDLSTGALADGPSDRDWRFGCTKNPGRGRTQTLSQRRKHELVLIEAQTVSPFVGPAMGAMSDKAPQIYSCFCKHCRWHVVFEIHPSPETPCAFSNPNDNIHHIVWCGQDAGQQPETKYNPTTGREKFRCSASNCGFRVNVEVSQPRVNEEYIDFLTDTEAILARKQKCLEEDPERFETVRDRLPNASGILSRYLDDVLHGRDDKKIDKRNVIFLFQFGHNPTSESLFRYLEFPEFSRDQSNFWGVPKVEISSGPTPPGSRLAFYQDVKGEVDMFVPVELSQQSQQPRLALPELQKAFNIENKLAVTRAFGQQYRDDDFDALGITDDTHESLLWYAFTCQRQAFPEGDGRFFAALQRLSVGRNNEDLENKVMTEASLRDSVTTQTVPGLQDEDEDLRRATEMSLMEVQSSSPSSDEGLLAAYKHFNLDGPPETEDLLVGRFKVMCEASPAQKLQHREALLLIGTKTNNTRYVQESVQSMSLKEALLYLEFEPESQRDTVANVISYYLQVTSARGPAMSSPICCQILTC